MERKNKFISIVAIGNFNPAILKPHFLSEKCGFKSESQPKGRTTPVVSEVVFDNITFLMDLERFQITERHPADFKETKTIKIMKKYLEVLSYTPVYTMGSNFNIEIINESEKIVQNLNDKNYLLEALKTEELIYSSKIKYSKESILCLSWELLKKGDNISQIAINLKKNIFTINYNTEIRDIYENNTKKNFFNENHDNINLEFEAFLKSLFL